MRSIEDLQKRVFRTISLLDMVFGLLVVWMAYFYVLIKEWDVIQVGEHILESDSEWGHLAQTVTGLIVSLVADRYGRTAAILCRRFVRLMLTFSSVRFEARTQHGHNGVVLHAADIGPSHQSTGHGFQLSVNTRDTN